jgi:Bacterial SH3 domain.
MFLNIVKANAAAQAPISRSQAEQRALNMINFRWTYASMNDNMSSQYSQLVTRPSQFNNAEGTSMTGIPYNWGGTDSLDSYSLNAPWVNFADAINKGAFAGNVNIESGYGYIPGTAGIDCSGFVQSVFNIKDSKLSTSTLFNNYFIRISLSEIKHMDILNKPYDHVVIFDRWGTLNGVNGAFTYESTPDTALGGIQGTKSYFISMDEINNGYIPGRYVNIADDSTAFPHPVNSGVFAQVISVNEWANIRQNPSTSSPVIGTIPKSQIMYLAHYNSGWYQINYNGHSGWIWGSLVGSIPSGQYVAVKDVYYLNIRSSAGSSSQIIGVLGKGQYAKVLDYSKDGLWYKISVNGMQGWAYSKYLNYIY